MNIDSDFLAKLSKIQVQLILCGFPNPVVTGGAIRDMLFDKPIKDIDIFYNAPKKGAGWNLPNYFSVKDHDETYEGGKFRLTHSLTSKILPVPIQLIKVDGNIEDHIDTFPINICTSYYKNHKLTIPDHVIKSDNTKVMEIDANCPSQYKKRILEKYSDWFVDEGAF